MHWLNECEIDDEKDYAYKQPPFLNPFSNVRMEESIQSSKVGLEGNEVFEVPKDYEYWFDDDLESASNCLHESGKLQVSCSKYIVVDKADSYDSQDHVSVDSSHDAEEGEDIVDFEALAYRKKELA